MLLIDIFKTFMVVQCVRIYHTRNIIIIKTTVDYNTVLTILISHCDDSNTNFRFR